LEAINFFAFEFPAQEKFETARAESGLAVTGKWNEKFCAAAIPIDWHLSSQSV